ncbi:MAG: hypothetical protein HDS66_08420 [Bacteroidales bacterium]|nr:hypothetical protein [Bacteroidales bacterium]
MKNVIRAMLIALAFAVATISANASPTLATIQKAKDVVEAARYQLPAEAGYGLMLTQVSYDSNKYTLVYRYYATMPATKPTAEAINEIKQAIIHMVKAQPNSEEMQLLKGGISFHYNYYTTEGTFLYAIKITPADVK